MVQGFGWHASESDVDSKVARVAKQSIYLQIWELQITEVSIPLHRKGNALWTAIGLEGLTNQMMHGNAMGTGWRWAPYQFSCQIFMQTGVPK